MMWKFFDQKTIPGKCVTEQPGQELDKPVIKEFKRRRVSAIFKDNI